MKTLYFDCFAGASGDMILGSLVAAGVEPRALIDQLQLLGVAGWKIDFETVDRSGISATHARVQTAHEHAHRHLSDILKIIYQSQLKQSIKDRTGLIFSRLAEAEARVHNQPVEKIHFHEVGAIDAIIDVCGAAIGFDLLGIEDFISSPLRVGFGMARMAHGSFPIPPPAVAELLRDRPIYAGDVEGEFVTPTGAAIITSVCDRFENIPAMKIESTGYGAGSRDPKGFPNALRLLVGETAAVANIDETRIAIEGPPFVGGNDLDPLAARKTMGDELHFGLELHAEAVMVEAIDDEDRRHSAGPGFCADHLRRNRLAAGVGR